MWLNNLIDTSKGTGICIYKQNRNATVLFTPSHTQTHMHTHMHMCLHTSILRVAGLEMKAPGEIVFQSWGLVDGWFSGWFYEEIPLWSQLGSSERDEWRRLPESFDGEVEWDKSRGNKALPASTRSHTNLNVTHKIVQQIKCAAGCMRPEGKRETGKRVSSQYVSRRAAKSSSTSKSTADLISPQMDS